MVFLLLCCIRNLILLSVVIVMAFFFTSSILFLLLLFLLILLLHHRHHYPPPSFACMALQVADCREEVSMMKKIAAQKEREKEKLITDLCKSVTLLSFLSFFLYSFVSFSYSITIYFLLCFFPFFILSSHDSTLNIFGFSSFYLHISSFIYPFIISIIPSTSILV